MDAEFLPEDIAALFSRYASVIRSDLNDLFGCEQAVECDRVSRLVKYYLAPAGISGAASFSGTIFLNPVFYYKPLTNRKIAEQTRKLADIPGEEGLFRSFVRGIMIHEYSHILHPSDDLELYCNPRFDDEKRRRVFSASAAIIEDAGADRFISETYPECSRYLKTARTLLALASLKRNGSTSDPLLYAAIKVLAPEICIHAVKFDAARLELLLRKVLAQTTVAGKLKYIEKISDFISEYGRHDVSQELRLFLTGYDTHYLSICRDYFNVSIEVQSTASLDDNGGSTILMEDEDSDISPQALAQLFSSIADSIGASFETFINGDPPAESGGSDDNSSWQIPVDEGDSSNYFDLYSKVMDALDNDEINTNGDPFTTLSMTCIWRIPQYSVADEAIYKKITAMYSGLIQNFTSRIGKLIEPSISVREEKQLYGKGIVSSRLSDAKKRYWFTTTEEVDRPDFDVTFIVFNNSKFNGEDDKKALFRQNCIIPHRYLTYGLVAAAEVLDRNDIPTRIYCGAYNPIQNLGHQPDYRLLVSPDFQNSKYNIGRYLYESNTSFLNRIDNAPQRILSLEYISRILMKSLPNRKHVLIYISDYEAKAHLLPANEQKHLYSTTRKSVREMAQRSRTSFAAIAVDHNNISSSQSRNQNKLCYPVLNQAYPYTVQSLDRTDFPGLLLRTIEKSIRMVL